LSLSIFFFQAEDGIRDRNVTGVQTCALPICDCTSLGGKHVIAAHGCDVNATVHKSTLNQYGVLVRFSDPVSVTRFNTTILGVHGSVHFRRYIAWSFTGVSGAATPAHIASRLVPPTA